MKGAIIGLLGWVATLTAPGPFNDAWPPQRYQGELRNVRISFVEPGSPDLKVCGDGNPPLPSNLHYFGCSNQSGGGWIIIETPCAAPRDDDYARHLCHEIGHLNGWSGLHPAN